MPLSDEVLRMLACPGCKGPLREVDGGLLCTTCGLKFPVRDGIPVLLLGDAEKTQT